MDQLKKSLLELVIQTSTNLPPDVRAAMAAAMANEIPGTRASSALDVIATNIDMAADDCGPICQDTGMPTFIIHTPVGTNQLFMKAMILEAVAEATKLGKLRPNSVDSITGKNSGNNLGPGTPVMHWNQWESYDEIEVKLILKGGGCENTNNQYSVPCELPHLGRADRNLDGVRKCILHAVWQAQGKGCAAGAIGVCIGGDRTSGYEHAKEQLFRTLDDTNPNPQTRGPRRLHHECRQYPRHRKHGIRRGRHPDRVQNRHVEPFARQLLRIRSLRLLGFPSAWRRPGCQNRRHKRWLYRDDKKPVDQMAKGGEPPRTGSEIKLSTPLSEKDVRQLNVGDIVLISGDMFTGRDQVHAHLMKHQSLVDLNGAALYHCGPVVLKEGEGWKMTAAGPTTSIREEPYQAEVIRRFGIRAVIGKGGMGAKTLAGLKEHGAVYLNAIGGAAQYYARCIKRVKDVHLMEFGIPEAMWHIEVEDFPAIVTMDSHGNSLHADVEKASAAVLAKLANPVF